MKKVWYVLSVALLLTALIFGGAMSAAADTTDAIGDACGANVTWAYANNVLTISGEGAMGDYNTSSAPWSAYEAEIKEIKIGEGVTKIGMAAFSGLSNLTTVTFGDNSALTAIGADAFYNCAALKGIVIPSNVTEIGDWAFFGCKALETVTFPAGLNSVGTGAFHGCKSLSYVHFAGLKQIGSVVFKDSGVQTIDFCGTQAEWDAIEKSASWDAEMVSYTLSCLHDRIVEVDENSHKYGCEKCDYKSAEMPHNWEEDTSNHDGNECTKSFICQGCKRVKQQQIHSSTNKWTSINENYHQSVCACGSNTYIAAHSWGKGEVKEGDEATHTKEGVMTYTCEDCKFTKTQPIAKTADHAFGDWVSCDDAEHKGQHKHTCACGAVEYAAHEWNEGKVTTGATCKDEGVKTYSCTTEGCTGTKTEILPKAPHEYEDTWESVDENMHKHTCACGAEEYAAHSWDNGEVTSAECAEFKVTVYKCTAAGCEGQKTETTKQTEKIPHTFDTWVNCEDEEHKGHHKSTCKCGAVEYAAHEWDAGTQSVDPTHFTEGEMTYSCTAKGCKATKTEILPKKTEHVYGDEWESADEFVHKKECACGEGAKFEAHKWDDVVIISEHTHVTNGKMKYTCTSCGEVKYETIPAGHTYGEWIPVDLTQHKKVCECTEGTIYEGHKWTIVTTTKATCKEEGVKTYTCDECGFTMTEQIPKTTTHSFSNWTECKDTDHEGQHQRKCNVCDKVEYADHVWSKSGKETVKPTHLTEGVKTYTCTANGCKATKTDPIAKTTEHTFGDWVKCEDEEHEGQHMHTCACGEVEYADHEWDAGKETVKPTHLTEGVKTYKCKAERCEATKTEPIAKTTEHTFGDWRDKDEYHHERVCECGEASDDHHEWGKGVISVTPTDEEEGQMTYKCGVCGREKTEVIPKIEGGCSSTIAGGAALMLLLSIGSAGLVFKKKED